MNTNEYDRDYIEIIEMVPILMDDFLSGGETVAEASGMTLVELEDLFIKAMPLKIIAYIELLNYPKLRGNAELTTYYLNRIINEIGSFDFYNNLNEENRKRFGKSLLDLLTMPQKKIKMNERAMVNFAPMINESLIT
ncbi:hypothetical protein [Bacillus suaedaesalsae]|uniref:DUF3969 family protein n=1 Tax=Bacillus suaedaesalsae TaxID=2810349 RepID=A0ABS2DI87_9BACI|nr:hypothetical protein [Bacillus suaedaesalsae]MBM6617276.1 hypothetical protein [Bacillus suaedaesalsae]